MNKVILVLLGVVFGIWTFAGVSQLNQQDEPVGSISYGSAYKSTMLVQGSATTNVLKTTPGTLGSVIINTVGTGQTRFYDATTTDATKRALATTSLSQIAFIAPSQAVGTYVYDVSFYNGLIVDTTGTQSTSTLTWR